GPPKVVTVFGLPANDGAISLRQANEREHAGVFQKSVLLVARDDGGDDMPMSRRHTGVTEVRPKHRNLALLRRASGAVLCADCLHLIEILRVLVAGQRRRTGWHERFDVRQTEWLHVTPVRIKRWAKERRRAPPLAGSVAR